MVGESGKKRGNFKSEIMNNELKTAAKELREREDIIIRRGDKSAVFVIMKRGEYNDKLDNIIGDTSKFEKLNEDPTEILKKRISA